MVQAYGTTGVSASCHNIELQNFCTSM